MLAVLIIHPDVIHIFVHIESLVLLTSGKHLLCQIKILSDPPLNIIIFTHVVVPTPLCLEDIFVFCHGQSNMKPKCSQLMRSRNILDNGYIMKVGIGQESEVLGIMQKCVTYGLYAWQIL